MLVINSLMLLLPIVQGIVLNPPVWLEGEAASITCSDAAGIAVYKDDVSITVCLTDVQYNCDITTDIPQAPVNYTEYYSVSKTSNSVSINIVNVSRDRDSGVWKCHGSLDETVTIDVKVPTSSASITDRNDITLNEGQITTVTCQTGVSYPRDVITWSINGGNNLGSGTTSNNSDGTTTSILQYTADKSDDNKILQCTATNGYGTPKTDSVTLNITSQISSTILPEVTGSIQVTTSDNIFNGSTITISPNNLTNLLENTDPNSTYQDDVTIEISKPEVNVGEEISITCSTSSNPVGSITWYRGNEIQQTKWTKEDTYIIKQATCLDTGVYSCKARNDGVRDERFSLPQPVFVKCRQAAKVRNTIQTRFVVNLGQTAKFLADVIAYPPPTYSWYFVDKTTGSSVPVTDSQFYKLSSIGSLTSLLITVSSSNLYGTYLLAISNDVGDTTLSFNLTPTTRPDSPHNLHVTSSSTQQICFSWNPGFNGGLNQTFAVELKMASADTWLVVTQDMTSHEYCLTQLTPDTSYNIRVEGRNSLGQGSPSHVLLATTSESPSTDGLGFGAGVGLGVCLTVVLIILIGIIGFIYCRQNKGKRQHSHNKVENSYSGHDLADMTPPVDYQWKHFR